ncbi:methyl-accepting chemotaxis protein [Paraburkholderia lycopersici]|uniref:Aerotaxis receptor n=1 Tax=Paraburkholderia lycopersici TaxID=416944 RepID=A0A1G6HEE1_9BURK|nr:PAS domain-containing methyl-accepting chemotaxis protein [Paraburkholderia lycopersici]SDB92629.1 aerotaxis receptor [Paraburkholderia lycopersici]
MRNNQPVTQRERELPANSTLMSKTDAQGRINYANVDFVQASGFSADELQGQPHNIVRHPDMPGEAFADMWRTLKDGQPWSAVVKNRHKSGDHYWVTANAVPIVRGGQTTGYLSIRTRPSREEIAAAEALYRDFREGRAGKRSFHKGLIVRSGLMKITSLFKTASVRTRLHLAMAAFAAWQIAGFVIAGPTSIPAAVTAGFALAGMAALTVFFGRQIATPLERVLKGALEVASGDRYEVKPLDRVDEIGMINRVVGQLGLILRWLALDVNGQVAGVRTASREIAQGNLDLSRRTEQAATSVQQTASAMAEITSATQSNAETAREAALSSAQTRDAATKGGQAIEEVVVTMGDVTSSSRRITDIIGVIEGIAFQTNILALNAAVEAARAGDQGRGFAVVAGEVRALAQRSATAAGEIKQLIGESVSTVDSQSSQVNETGQTMKEIVEQVKRVSGLIAEISAAISEQSIGMTQIDGAIEKLDEIAQQNAALVEETAAASENLKQQATQLAQAVSVFC